MITKYKNFIFESVLSEAVKNRVERIILVIAILSFLAHLITIYLVRSGFIVLTEAVNFFDSPIAAIYTPFSFILIYEVYLFYVSILDLIIMTLENVF